MLALAQSLNAMVNAAAFRPRGSVPRKSGTMPRTDPKAIVAIAARLERLVRASLPADATADAFDDAMGALLADAMESIRFG